MALWLLVLALAAPAAPQRPADIVAWTADAPAQPVRAGETVTITLKARVEKGWKLYALVQPAGGPTPLTIRIAKRSPFALSRAGVDGPEAKLQQDDWFPVETAYYDGDVTFTVPVRVPRAAAAGTHVVPLEVTFQACGANICLRPFTQRVEATLTVGSRRR